MAMVHYPWQRFWVKQGSNLQVDDAGFLVDPDSPWLEPTTALVSDLSEIADIPCVVLLGEPGSGKTTALSEYRDQVIGSDEGSELIWADLRDFTSSTDLREELFGQSKLEDWKRGSHLLWLFLDGLDEGLENYQAFTRPLVTRIETLPVERLRLRITCRTAEWPASFEHDLSALWPVEKSDADDIDADKGSEQHRLAVYEIAPLRQTDVALAARMQGLDPETFLSDVFKHGAQAFALKPVTLSFLLDTFLRDGALRGSSIDLYHEGCLRKCDEVNPWRRDLPRERSLTAGERLRLGKRIAALTVLGNRAAIWLGPVNQKPGTDLTIDDLIGNPVIGDDSSSLDSASSIAETLESALFTSRGTNRLGWDHQTLAEFLAAQFLVDTNVSLSQVESLLFHPTDGQVIPELRGVAAWAASMREDVLTLVSESDPDVAIQGDLVPVTDSVKARVTDALLRKFAKMEIIDDWASRANYRKLCHPHLEDQLRPIITDPNADFLVRRVAIDIAEACEQIDLQYELLHVALDTGDRTPDRINAAYSVWRIGDASTRSRLLPLISEPTDTDPDFELRGVALQALWPEFLSTEEMFRAIVPIDSHLFGEYNRFLHYLPKRLTPSDFVSALEWVSQQKRSFDLPFNVEELINETLLTARQHLSHEGVLPALAQAIWSRLMKHHHDFRTTESRDEIKFLDDEVQRRELTRVIARLIDGSVNSTYLLMVEPRLLDHGDTFWLIEELSLTPDEQQQLVYAKLIWRLADMASVPHIDAVLAACENSPALAAEFGNPLAPIELNSPEAEDQRRRYQEAQDLFKPRETPIQTDEPSPLARFQEHLQAVETGESNRWWQATWLLGFQDDQYRGLKEFETDIRLLPGWQLLEDSTRRQIIQSAPRYLVSLSDSDEIRRLDPDKDRRNIAGYRALRLLLHENIDALDGLPTEVWEAWAPTILGMRMQSEVSASDDQAALSYHSYQKAPRRTLEALSELLVDRNSKHDDYVGGLEWARPCWDSRIEEALLTLVQRENLRKASLQVVLRELVSANAVGTQQLAEQLIRKRNDSEDCWDRATVTGAMLLEHARDAGWPILWPILEEDPAFGRSVVESAVAWFDVRGGIDLRSRLQERQLAELYVWLESQYPEDQDPGYDSGRTLTTITNRHEVAEFRNSLIRQLRDKGTFEARQQLMWLSQMFPDNYSLKLNAINAGQLARQVTWVPPTPDEILALARDRSKRLVQSEGQLLAAVIEVLSELQKRLQGETPRVRSLWNEFEGKYRPKEEEDITDYVKGFLEDRLVGRGIIFGREVQIRRPGIGVKGEDTDIHVDAIRKVRPGRGFEKLTVIIEVKGGWNRHLFTAMEDQLLNRYLNDNQCSHGLYLVSWTNCSQWDKGDRRRRHVRRSIEDVREQLEKQASNLSREGTDIRAFVLDATYR